MTDSVAEAVLDVRSVQALGFGVGIGDGGELRKRGTVRVVVFAHLVGCTPEGVEGGLRSIQRVAAEADKVESEVALERETSGARSSDGRQHDRRVRRLQRARPDVHVGVLGVLSVPRKGLTFGPRRQDEGEVLVEPGPRLDGRNTVVEAGVIGEAERESGDESPTADVVDNGVLFGHAKRLTRLTERSTEHVDADLESLGFRGICECRGDQIRVRAHVVVGLSVLGHADAVESGASCVHHLVESVGETPHSSGWGRPSPNMGW